MGANDRFETISRSLTQPNFRLGIRLGGPYRQEIQNSWRVSASWYAQQRALKRVEALERNAQWAGRHMAASIQKRQDFRPDRHWWLEWLRGQWGRAQFRKFGVAGAFEGVARETAIALLERL